jgi:cell fate regulator YaaT (PSP1 superfamily)
VFDWLAGIPLHDGAKPFPIIEVSFQRGSRKEFYRNTTPNILEKGDWIAIEGTGGFDVGQVSLTGELVKLQMKKYGVQDKPDLKKVLRLAGDEDIALYNEQKAREQEILVRSRAIAREHKLDMKVAEVELQADGKKVTIFYTAEQRVDFREIIRIYATDFRARVEMRQIGARQESAKVGGIGSCGRELCCSTWLTDFKTVNTGAARYQNLSINQTKLSGQCGRLKCCLNYELDTYMDGLKAFPSGADKIEVAKGIAMLQKRDIFKNLMWYTLPGSSKQYPLTIDRVKEIQALNKQGTKPDELGAVEIETASERKGLKVDTGFVNDVGQITLRSLERNSRKSHSKKTQPGKRKEGEVAITPRPAGDRRRENRPAQPPKPQQQTPTGNIEGRPQQPRQNPPRPKPQSQGGENRPPKEGSGPNQQRPPRQRPPRPKGDGPPPTPQA